MYFNYGSNFGIVFLIIGYFESLFCLLCTHISTLIIEKRANIQSYIFILVFFFLHRFSIENFALTVFLHTVHLFYALPDFLFYCMIV